MVCSDFRKKVKDKDMFGHSVVFNFNRQGETFKTSCGGMLSIIIMVLLTIYASMRYSKMINKEDNSQSSTILPADFDAIGTKSLTDMELMPILKIRNTSMAHFY